MTNEIPEIVLRAGSDYKYAIERRVALENQQKDAHAAFMTALEDAGLYEQYRTVQNLEDSVQSAAKLESTARKELSNAWDSHARKNNLMGVRFGPVAIRTTSEVQFDPALDADTVLRVFTQNASYRDRLVEHLTEKPTRLITIGEWRAMESLRDTQTANGETLLPDGVHVVDVPQVRLATDVNEWTHDDDASN